MFVFLSFLSRVLSRRGAKVSLSVAEFAIVDGFRVALPILRWVVWFCLADGFRVALPIHILCHLLCM